MCLKMIMNSVKNYMRQVRRMVILGVRIDRGTQKIYYETSSDDTNWTLRATLSGTVTGDLRFGFFGNKTGKTIDNAYIQADLGLN